MLYMKTTSLKYQLKSKHSTIIQFKEIKQTILTRKQEEIWCRKSLEIYVIKIFSNKVARDMMSIMVALLQASSGN